MDIRSIARLKQAWNRFSMNHPKFPEFLRAVKSRGIHAGMEVSITLTGTSCAPACASSPRTLSFSTRRAKYSEYAIRDGRCAVPWFLYGGVFCLMTIVQDWRPLRRLRATSPRRGSAPRQRFWSGSLCRTLLAPLLGSEAAARRDAGTASAVTAGSPVCRR